jgi:hypothetical protein
VALDVFAAIREQRLYIFTDSEFTDAVRAHLEAILAAAPPKGGYAWPEEHPV